MGLLASKQILYDLHHARNSGRAAHEHDFVNLVRRQGRIRERLLHGTDRALQQILHQLLQLRARQLLLHVLRPGCIGREEWQIDVSLLGLRKLDLGFFGRLPQSLNSHSIFADIDALIFLEFRNQPIHDPMIDIVASQVGITVGRLHLHDALAYLQDGDIEGAAAQVVDRDGFVLFLVQAIGKGRSGRLIDDSQDLQSSNFARLFGRLPLAIVEIGRNGDHCLGDLLAEEILGGGLQFLQNHRGNLGRAIGLAKNLNTGIVMRSASDLVGHSLSLFADLIIAASHKTLDRIDGILGIGHRLALGYLPHQAFACLGYAYHRWRCACPFLVGNDNGFSALHHGNHGIGGAQINADNLAHLFLRRFPVGGSTARVTIRGNSIP